ncbi:MAG: beta-1,6-galactofuranosyltransferase, partial [Streptococcus sp.]
MRVHFTNLFGQSPRSVALIAQNDTMKIAKELGANELAIYFYDNSQESSGELNSRLDGIVAGVSYGDIVFFQSPSWNSVAWDTSLIHKFRAVQTKLVMFIHDVPPIMFPSNYFLMPNYIEMYNLCDVVVVPSEQMRDRLIEEGLTVKKIIIQELWDLPHN